MLKLIINEFNLININIEKFSKYESDKSLTSHRNINYSVPDYKSMLKDLKEYYNLNKTYTFRFYQKISIMNILVVSQYFYPENF